jgi:hydrogenase/urease accessory protein HupE
MNISLSKNLHRLFFLLASISPSFAHAHSMAFTEVDWNSGFFHPLQCLDHILAMLAVGFWAAHLRGVALWLLPLIFVSVMALGSLLGTSGFTSPYAELIILSSGVVLSVFAIKKVQFDLKIIVLIVSFLPYFTVMHMVQKSPIPLIFCLTALDLFAQHQFCISQES